MYTCTAEKYQNICNSFFRTDFSIQSIFLYKDEKGKNKQYLKHKAQTVIDEK